MNKSMLQSQEDRVRSASRASWVWASGLFVLYSLASFVAVNSTDRLARMVVFLVLIGLVPAAFLALYYPILVERQRGTKLRLVRPPGRIKFHYVPFIVAGVLGVGMIWMLQVALFKESFEHLRYAHLLGATVLVSLGFATWSADRRVAPRLPFRVTVVRAFLLLCILSAAALAAIGLAWA